MCHTTKLNEHKLFALIRQEHAAGLEKINHATTTIEKMELLLWLWFEIENSLHQKEELYLFSELLNRSGLSEGGPYCVLYFDEHITNRPQQQAMKITQQEPTWSKHQIQFKMKQSPLDIPLEEHRSMRSILEYLIAHRDTLKEEQFHDAFDAYAKLYRHHTKKEEQCLFCVCHRLLSNDDLDLVYEKWLHHTPTSE